MKIASFRCHDENGNGDAKMLFWYLCACARLRGNPKLTFCFRDQRQIGHFNVVPQRWNILIKHGWWKWSKHEQTTLKGKFLSFKVRNESLLSYQTISNVTHSFISKEFFVAWLFFNSFSKPNQSVYIFLQKRAKQANWQQISSQHLYNKKSGYSKTWNCNKKIP